MIGQHKDNINFHKIVLDRAFEKDKLESKGHAGQWKQADQICHEKYNSSQTYNGTPKPVGSKLLTSLFVSTRISFCETLTAASDWQSMYPPHMWHY